MIFNKLGIDTETVLKAAGTKWNFLPFRPGLVGGHCIGVDPYYLTHKSEEIGYHPMIISAGRRINDGMGAYVSSQLVKFMLKQRIQVRGSKVLVMGMTFKENCPDLRNTLVVQMIEELSGYGINVEVYDPWANTNDAKREYNITPIKSPDQKSYHGIVLAVAHDEFRQMGVEGVRKLGKKNHVLYDLKYLFDQDKSDLRL